MNRHRGQTRTVWHVSSPSGLLFCQLPELPRPARGGLRRAVRRHPGHVLPRWSRPPYARARDEINEELRLAGTCSRVSLNRVASSWSPPPGCSRATSRWRRRRRPRIKRRRAPSSRTSASGSERCRRRASAGAVRRVAQVGV